MPSSASLRVIVKRRAKLQSIISVGRAPPGEKSEAKTRALEQLHQLVVEMVVIRQTQAAGRRLKALVGPESVNSKDIA